MHENQRLLGYTKTFFKIKSDRMRLMCFRGHLYLVTCTFISETRKRLIENIQIGIGLLI